MKIKLQCELDFMTIFWLRKPIQAPSDVSNIWPNHNPQLQQNNHSITFPLKQEFCDSSGAVVIDLPLLNVSLTFPAVSLMKQCQIWGDIKNRRTSEGGDVFYQSVVYVSLESVSVCVRIDVSGCVRTLLCMLLMPMTQALAGIHCETQPEPLASTTHHCLNIHSVIHLPGKARLDHLLRSLIRSIAG